LVAFNQYQYNKTNYRILYEKRSKTPVLIYTGWQMFLLDILFVTFIILTNLRNYSMQQFLYSSYFEH